VGCVQQELVTLDPGLTRRRLQYNKWKGSKQFHVSKGLFGLQINLEEVQFYISIDLCDPVLLALPIFNTIDRKRKFS
jgi:hypothetical protein